MIPANTGIAAGAIEAASAADVSLRPSATSRTNGNPQSRQKSSPSHQAAAGRRAPRRRIVGASTRAPTPNRSAMMSQIRSSWVTLKRVITNQPEKSISESVAQMHPVARCPSDAAVPVGHERGDWRCQAIRHRSGGPKRQQRVEDCLRPEAFAVINFDIGESDTAVLGDHIGRGHRQFPALIAVDPRQCFVIRPQSSAQLLGQRIDEAEPAGRIIAHVAQVNSSACAVERDCSGSCGEIATSRAPKAVICGRAA